ncbi:MAG: aryl-sulfate sulfotransferase [Halolamina sp.]
MTDQPSRTTLLSIQGARGSNKTVAMLVGIRPNGEVIGIYNGSANGRWWLYDVDTLQNGNLLLSTTEPGVSIVEEIDSTTGEQVSEIRFQDVLDSHDADLINGDELLINDMSQGGDDRIFVYNRTREEVVWEYRFAEHPEAFPRSGGGEYGDDWTHNNDVAQIRPGVFMVSVRNFDQVVAIDRETKEIRWRLGEDERLQTLFEQHNPDYLSGANETPTVLVADSRNDRVVEYAREDGEWTETWVLEGGELNEPRDADRLPNGNTLVVDRRGHRLLEVTPTGEVVWEFYAPWQPYDAERIGTGDESFGPTARQIGATGTYEMTGSAGVNESRAESCYAFLTNWTGGSQLLPADSAQSLAGMTEQSTEWKSETPTDPFPNSSMVGGASIALLVAALLLVRRSTDGES